MKVLVFTRSGPGVADVKDDYGWPVERSWRLYAPGAALPRHFRRIIYASDNPDIVNQWGAWGAVDATSRIRTIQIPVYLEVEP